jgi:hypothetical protein
VDLARCKALALLRRDRSAPIFGTLNDLMHARRAPEHIRWSAARWALRIETNGCEETTRSPLYAALQQAAATADRQRRHVAAVNLALAQLDAGIASHAEAKTAAALARLQELEPGLMTHLLCATGDGSAAAFVAIHYPY